ncbi:MAG: M24 family metallopeptidase [Acidobacteriota bacterium]
MIRWSRALVWLGAALGGAVSPAAASAYKGMAVGLPPEPSLLVLVLRILAGGLALVLLLAGGKAARLSAGAFFLIVGGGVSYFFLSSLSYLLAAAGAFLFLAVLMRVFLHLPRLASALLALWPLPLAYAAYVLNQGTLRPKPIPLLVLAAGGALLGALLPRAGQVLQASTLGAILLGAATPWAEGYWILAAAAAVSLAWQALLLLWLAPAPLPWTESAEVRSRRLRHEWRQALKWGAGMLLLVFMAPSLVAPAPGSDEAHPGRMDALRKSGGLGRPGLLLSAADSYYLFGKAHPVAILSEGGGWAARLALPWVGASPSKKVHGLRTVKDAQEIDRIRRASALTAKAMENARPLIRPGANESEVEAAVLATFRSLGASGLAFEPVVGSGPNAVRPHYMDNDAELRDGFLVLDIGCMVEGYASDMTRTFPVGEATPAQKALYRTVLQAKAAASSAARPGAPYASVDQAARVVIEKAGFGPYFSHGIGHHVGIKVHDVHAGVLAPGMVVTIEPGIYIPADAEVDPAYRGLGVRIEDTYLITQAGAERLGGYPEDPLGLADADRPVDPPEGGQPLKDPDKAL